MEFPRGAIALQRALAVGGLAASLGLAWVEAGSPLAARERDGRPWLAWIEARERGVSAAPSFHLALWDPVRRRLTVLHAPGEAKLDKRRTLDKGWLDALKASDDPDAAARAAEDLAEARLRELSPEPIPEVTGRLRVEVPPLGPDDEPSAAAVDALLARGRSARAWLRLARDAARGLRSGDRAAADGLLFALELRKAPRGAERPARLPDEAQAPALLGRLFGADPLPDGRATVAEALNGTAEPGLAARAAKMLRLSGVDVLAVGADKAAARERTVVYDRVGDFARARRVLDALRCPSARAVTRVDASRAVDASVLLGADCAAVVAADAPREP